MHCVKYCKIIPLKKDDLSNKARFFFIAEDVVHSTTPIHLAIMTSHLYKNIHVTSLNLKAVIIYIYIYIYVWKLNQTVLELDFRAVNFLFFPRRDLNSHHWYTAAPFAKHYVQHPRPLDHIYIFPLYFRTGTQNFFKWNLQRSSTWPS
jgi:hypothetical protein